MKALLQSVHDAGIAGSISWLFDRVFDGVLEVGGERTTVVVESTADFATWLAAHVPAGMVTTWISDDLRLIQVLHDHEFSGSVEWRPGEGWWARLGERRLSQRLASWAEAEAWLRAEAEKVLRLWIDAPEYELPRTASEYRPG